MADTPSDQFAQMARIDFERVAALKRSGLLEGHRDPRLDGITAMAADIFDVPISAISMIDGDKQIMKSAVGMELQEIPRDVSICARAIEGDDLLVLENLASDGPFQNHPFVVGASHFRFYAGAPITIRGFKFGTLCIADTKPRTFTTTDRRRLNRLAQMVVDHILYDEISNKARAENREYRAILEACQDAMLVLNADLEIVIENTASQEVWDGGCRGCTARS